jgi:hypothetical protein
VTSPFGSRDRVWIAILAGFFLFGVAASWQRWGNPVVDIGREMNQPLRLASGEMLYSDVRHIYGPTSPWFHAALYRLFGPSLAILYADGAITAMIALGLIYWLGRQILNPAGAGVATLNVMWLCVFKPAGNYILPYSFNALHGTALGLVTLVVLVTALKRTAAGVQAIEMRRLFLMAGILTALTTLTKTEMGIATLAAALTAAALAARLEWRQGLELAALVAVPAACLTIGVYAIIAARVGWFTLLFDSWLLLYNMPPELAYFNSQVSGFANPARSIGRILLATMKLGIIAAIIAGVAGIVSNRTKRPAGMTGNGEPDTTTRGLVARPWKLLVAAVGLLIVMSITTGLDADKGPYLAMPLLLVGFMVMLAADYRREKTSADTLVLICLSVYALLSLTRMILHVRSGGAYASYLLPVSVLIFMYLWVRPFADRFNDPRAGHVARSIALGLMLLAAVASAFVQAVRYRARNTEAVSTARGTLITEPDIGRAFNEALAYLERNTRPGDYVAVMPEGTSLDFLSGRRNPLRDEIAIPGALDTAAEERAIQRLYETRTRLVLITNRPTAEFGHLAFGRDYYQHLMQAIETHYTRCALFGPVKDPAGQIGDPEFFIRAYCRREP